MTLEDRIKAMNANITAARASHSMDLENRKHGLDAMQTVSRVRLDWVKAQMEWNAHVLENQAKAIENAKSALELRMMHHAFRRFRMEEHRLVVKRKRATVYAERAQREIRWASQVFEGIHLKRRDIVRTWRSFGRLTLQSAIIFPATDGTCFSDKTEATPEMTMYGLSQHCRYETKRLKATSEEFGFVRKAWGEASTRHIEELAEYESKMAALEEKLLALSKGQWSKAGII